ncbi:MAG: hypothetical protein AAF460_12250 [Pseudomonadota bacterium]
MKNATALLLCSALGLAGCAGHQGHHTMALSEPGQDAFAAIAEVVAHLRADDGTAWDRVDIDALRAHLLDMHRVTLLADARTARQADAVVFTVTGTGDTVAAIQRMTRAHAHTVATDTPWTMRSEPREDGAEVVVRAPDDAALDDVVALGFFGVMSVGGHHQAHHLAIATGSDPHAH